MNRQLSINAINDKYGYNHLQNNTQDNTYGTPNINTVISQGIASNLAPTTIIDHMTQQSVPISITNAQRNTLYGYSNTNALQTVGHNSRVGQIMYDEEGFQPRPRSQHTKRNSLSSYSSNWIIPVFTCLLLSILSVFVLVCIIRHSNKSFSLNSQKYYQDHPQAFVNQISLISSSSNISQKTLNYPGSSKIVIEQLINRKLKQGIIDSSDIIPPQESGLCHSNYFLFNNVCYPCKISLGYETQTKCPSNSTTPLTPVIQAPKCNDGAILYKDKCILCPQGTVWAGSSCLKLTA